MTAQAPAPSPWAARMMRTTGILFFWTFGWVASLALAKYGPGALWTEHTATTVAVLAMNVLLGIGMLWAHKQHLWAMDELQRTLQLQAMAWTLGAGLIFGTSCKVMEGHGLIAYSAQISDLIIFMAVAYFVAVVLGLKRYL